MKAFARATFRGYRFQPGEIRLKLPDASIEVELFRVRGENWHARSVQGRGIFQGIEGSIEQAMRLTRERFDTQETQWRWVDEHGREAEAANEPKDIYHLIGPESAQQQFPRVRRTLCGKTVMSHRIQDRLEKMNCPACRKALDALPVESE
jgi:formylmethanofuran dehydrogenase subunit E